jgi:hypothetical protein
MLCSYATVEDRDVCKFVENPLLLRTLKEEVGIQVAVAKSNGQDITPYQRRKVAFRTYSRICHGFLGRGVRQKPRQCTMDSVRGVWVSPSGSYAGLHERAAAVGDNKDNDEDNDRQKKKNKMMDVDSCPDRDPSTRAQGCTSTAALDDSQKNGLIAS